MWAGTAQLGERWDWRGEVGMWQVAVSAPYHTVLVAKPAAWTKGPLECTLIHKANRNLPRSLPAVTGEMSSPCLHVAEEPQPWMVVQKALD